MTPTFSYSDLLPLGDDTTTYRNLGSEGVSSVQHGDKTFLEISPEAISHLTETAMHDISHSCAQHICNNWRTSLKIRRPLLMIDLLR